MKSVLSAAVSAATLFCAAGAIAQTNEYGGYDVVGGPAISESAYGEARDWSVRAAFAGGTFAYCVAAYASDGYDVLLGWDAQQWQVVVPVSARPDWEGTLDVDGRGWGNGGGNNMSGTAIGDRTIAWLGMSELDGIRQGSQAVLGVGKVDYAFPLKGSAAAIAKVEECVQNAGAVPARQAATGPAGGLAQCDNFFAKYPCTVTRRDPEPDYPEVREIRDPARGQPDYFVKGGAGARSEVWVSYDHSDDWTPLGYWQPKATGDGCIEPGDPAAQAPDVVVNLGQDLWQLCVR